jgi:hypothetical protein
MPFSRRCNQVDSFFDRTDRYISDPGLAQREDVERLDRYDVLMRHEFDRLGLNPFQRASIAQALSETPPTTTSFILSLDDEIVEATRSPLFLDRWGDPPTAFIDKMRALTTAQKFAIVEAFERGWLGMGDPNETLPDE